MRNLLIELGFVFEAKTNLVVYGDSQATNLFANGQCNLRKVKHLQLNELYIRRGCEQEGIKVRYEELALNVTRILLSLDVSL